jgi:YfiH family protein
MIRHEVLSSLGLAHGFGERQDPEPEGTHRPRQVHGAVVVRAADCEGATPPEADAVLGIAGEGPVAVVTADCVPLLLASEDGRAVAAVHAGWRGLAAGVVEAGVSALQALSPGRALHAVVGPHIGPCCYEVDSPVIDALRARHPRHLSLSLSASRDGHADLDLGALARAILMGCGLASARVGALEGICTRCDPERFHSYRRDGPRSGRLLHHIRAISGDTQN